MRKQPNDIDLQIMWNRLLAVVEEQAQTLLRTAFSSIVREAGDLSAGIFDARLYQFVLGSMILSELAIHVRHLRNLFLFRAILSTNGIQGRMQYARPSMLRMSAVELFAFAGLYAFLFLFTFSWFVLGGVFSCFSIGVKHRSLAKKHSSAALGQAPSVQMGEPAAVSRPASR